MHISESQKKKSPNALLTTSHVIQITWTPTIDWIPKKTPGQEEIGSRNRRQGLAVQTLFELLSNSAFSARGVQFVCKRLPARSVADMFCWPFSPALGHACLRRCANEAADSSPFESDIAIFCLWRRDRGAKKAIEDDLQSWSRHNLWCHDGHELCERNNFLWLWASDSIRLSHPRLSSSHSGFSHDSSEGPLRPNSEARDGTVDFVKNLLEV